MGLGDPRSSSSRRFCSTPLWGHGTSERKTLRQKLQWPLKKKTGEPEICNVVNLLPKPFFFQVDILTLWYRHKLVKVWWIFPVDFSSFSKEKTKKNLSKHDFMFFLIKSSRNPCFCTKKQHRFDIKDANKAAWSSMINKFFVYPPWDWPWVNWMVVFIVVFLSRTSPATLIYFHTHAIL